MEIEHEAERLMRLAGVLEPHEGVHHAIGRCVRLERSLGGGLQVIQLEKIRSVEILSNVGESGELVSLDICLALMGEERNVTIFLRDYAKKEFFLEYQYPDKESDAKEPHISFIR